MGDVTSPLKKRFPICSKSDGYRGRGDTCISDLGMRERGRWKEKEGKDPDRREGPLEGSVSLHLSVTLSKSPGIRAGRRLKLVPACQLEGVRASEKHTSHNPDSFRQPFWRVWNLNNEGPVMGRPHLTRVACLCLI